MNGKDFLLGAVAGAILGSVTALLLAPKPGKELRADIAEGYGNVSRKTVEIAHSVGEKAQEIAGAVTEKSQQLASKAKELAGSVASDIKSWKDSRLEAASAGDEDQSRS